MSKLNSCDRFLVSFGIFLSVMLFSGCRTFERVVDEPVIKSTVWESRENSPNPSNPVKNKSLQDEVVTESVEVVAESETEPAVVEPTENSSTGLEPANWSAITVSNFSKILQEVRFIANTSPFGSFENIEELLSYVTRDATTDEEVIWTIYEYFKSKRKNFCGAASPIFEVRESESLSDRLFSYSFNCCSGVNASLAAIYNLLGYESTIIANPRHVFLEVTTDEGPFMVDGYLGSFFPYSFEESVANHFNYPDFISDGNIETYNSIFFDDQDKTYSYPPENLPFTQVSTDFSVELYPDETILFASESSINRLVSNPVQVAELIESYEESVFQYQSQGSLIHNLKYHVVDEDEQGCRVYELDSPYVMVQAEIQSLDLGAVESLYFSIDQTNWNLIDLNASNFAIDYNLFNQGIQEIVLDPNQMLDDWGGYSYRIYLEPIIVTLEMETKRDDMDLVLYEDGVALPPYPNDHSNLIAQGEGRYIPTSPNMLIFSTTDNSDPRTNGREYKIRVTTYTSLDEPFGRYQYFLKVCPNTLEDFSFEDSIKVKSIFQYNRLMLPEFIEEIENLNPETQLEWE